MDIESLNLNDTEQWRLKSIEAISFLQTKLQPYEWWIVQSSHFGDNRQAFTFFFPLVAGFLNILGAKTLWAAILVEWSNLILKWFFKGDRPYWWIHQSPIFNTLDKPLLRQFPNTCESGPGTPSGHIMMNVALFYIFIKGISKYYIWSSRRFRITKCFFSLVIYSLFVSWIMLVSISRLYIQAHFIHQCVFGILLGLLIGQMVWSSKWLTKPHVFGSLFFTSMLIGSSLSTYWLLKNNGLDPLWAIPLAMKYCEKTEYVDITTQPYFLMVRFTAVSLGLGLGLSSRNRRIANSVPKGLLRTVLTVKAGLLLGKALMIIQKIIPQDDLILYLSTNFALYTAFAYLVIATIPAFLHIVFPRW